MRGIIFLLGAVLGWVAIDHFSKANPTRRPALAGDAYPFPTSAAHAAVDLFEEGDVAAWASKLGCGEARIREAIERVGTSIARISEYLGLPRT